MLFVLLGEQPLQARENQLWASRNLYTAFQRSLIGLRESTRETIVKARDSLPPEVAEQYVQGLTMLIGEGYGNDPVQRLIDQLDDLARQPDRPLPEGPGVQWEIIAEIIMLIAELAIMAALMAFTGGASVSEMFLARARSRFAILMIVDRLLRMTHLMPSLSEAVEEAIQTLAVRLAQIGLNSGGRKPHGIDWADVGKAAAFGAVTGAFMGVFEKFFKPFKNIFKNLADDVLTKFKFKPDTLVFKGLKNGPGEIVGAFVIEGTSEGLAEYLINGAFEGNWEFKWETFVGAGSSGVFGLGAGLALGGAGLYTYNKWFADSNAFNDHINELPGTKGPLGSGDGSGSTKSPISISTGPSVTTTVTTNASLFTPGPVTPAPLTTTSTGPFGGTDSIVTPPPALPLTTTSGTTSTAPTPTQSTPLNTIPDITGDLSTSNPPLTNPLLTTPVTTPVTTPSLNQPSLSTPTGSPTPNFSPPRTSDSSPVVDFEDTRTTTPDLDLDAVLDPDGVSTTPDATDDLPQSAVPRATGTGGTGAVGGDADLETVRDGVQSDEDLASGAGNVAPPTPVSTSAGPQGASNGPGATHGSQGPAQQPGQAGHTGPSGQSNRPEQSEGALDQSDVSGSADIVDGTDGTESPDVAESTGTDGRQELDAASPGANSPTPSPDRPGTVPPGLRTSSDTPGQIDVELVETSAGEAEPVGDGPIAVHEVPPAAQPGATGRPTTPRTAPTETPLTATDADPTGAPDALDQDGRPVSAPQPRPRSPRPRPRRPTRPHRNGRHRPRRTGRPRPYRHRRHRPRRTAPPPASPRAATAGRIPRSASTTATGTAATDRPTTSTTATASSGIRPIPTGP